MLVCPCCTRSLAAPLALASLVLLAAPALARERGGWTYSMSAGTSLSFDQRLFGAGGPMNAPANFAGAKHWGPGIGAGFSAGASASLMLNRKSWGVYEGGYRWYRGESRRSSWFFPATHQTYVSFFSLGAGLRFHPWNTSPQPRGPYLQIIPTLFFGRWTVEDFTSNSRTLPGVAVSAGYRRFLNDVLSTDVGLRWAISDNMDRAFDYRGLHEVALVAGLGWSP